MQLPDLINGGFEAFGGFAIMTNVKRILKDKQVKGVNLSVTAFFTSWGLWNLFYYPNLGQWLSFSGGVLVVSANTIWLALAWRYRE